MKFHILWSVLFIGVLAQISESLIFWDWFHIPADSTVGLKNAVSKAAQTFVDGGKCALLFGHLFFKSNKRTARMLPYNSEEISFSLYTQDRREETKFKLDDDLGEKLSASQFNNTHATVIITHGYMDETHNFFFNNIELTIDAILSKGKTNVIAVDWSQLQKELKFFKPYDHAVFMVPTAGSKVAEMIRKLEKQGLNLNTTLLVGHSLGAHVMGVAGYQLRNKINYIIGLDPALPSYREASAAESLTRESAKMVEVIHTNGGACGIMSKVGHFDFYVNGGSSQSHVKSPFLDFNLRSPLLKLTTFSNFRSHILAFDFYIQSITGKKGFYGRRCRYGMKFISEDDCRGRLVKMGGIRVNHQSQSFELPDIKEGSYYVKTNVEKPYDLGLDF